ncbi:hypothetical protein [Parapedobacter koreensis]|uniref:Uncharacterized protein n=1 Tax=Parapedobacter koreensis TaxID=332977 RepID=A0A1H7UNW3_9SPHI|nr:hypothetical protein [Parapedobacter koreensis]SEL98653.1 hypothetical protein SAMN05421740_1207 [Parapedobacter koreensis]
MKLFVKILLCKIAWKRIRDSYFNYGTSGNQLQSITNGVTTYLYDANGNMTRDGRQNKARRFLMPGQQISRFGSNSGKFFSPQERYYLCELYPQELTLVFIILLKC